MSYDFNLVRIPPGSHPQTVIQASLAAEEASELNPGESNPTKEEAKRRLVAALQAVNPLLEAFPFNYVELARLNNISEQEAKRRFRHVELNGPEDGNGIQITLFDDTASITIPYWHHGRDAEEVLRETWSYLEVLEHEEGFQAYDPQLERLLSLRMDFNAVLGKYAEGVRFTDKISADISTGSRQQKPWWRFW